MDILLTCEWPADVTAATPPGSAPADASTAGESLRTGFTAYSNAKSDAPVLLCCPASRDDAALSLTPGNNAANATACDAELMLCPEALMISWQIDHTIGLSCAGSEVVSRLATKVRPRYHICGGRDVFYARQPYLNKDLGAGGYFFFLVLLTRQYFALHPCARGMTGPGCMPNLRLSYSTWLSILLHKAIDHGTATAIQPCFSLNA